jgi:hypothetical protein
MSTASNSPGVKIFSRSADLSGREGTLNLGMMQALMSSVMAIFFYALIIVAVWKLFQIATELGEIKTLLSDQSRAKTNPLPPPAVAAAYSPVSAPSGPISLESAEALLREVAAESHSLELSKSSV